MIKSVLWKNHSGCCVVDGNRGKMAARAAWTRVVVGERERESHMCQSSSGAKMVLDSI